MKNLFCEYQFVVRGNPQGVLLAVMLNIEALALAHKLTATDTVLVRRGTPVRRFLV